MVEQSNGTVVWIHTWQISYSCGLTCAPDSSENPTLAIADRATFCPLAKNVPAADPHSWMNPPWELSPLSHQNTPVIVTVDLRAQTARRHDSMNWVEDKWMWETAYNTTRGRKNGYKGVYFELSTSISTARQKTSHDCYCESSRLIIEEAIKWLW